MTRTFEQWKEQVDRHFVRECGLSADDLPDQPYRDWYEDKVSPKKAARHAIRYAREN